MKKYLVFISIVLIIASLTSCVSSKLKMLQETNQIKSIEIVEAYYDWNEDVPVQKKMIEVQDAESFINKLLDIDYSVPILPSSPSGIEYSSLAIKISYENGDYELLSRTDKTIYSDDRYDGYKVFGSFDYDQFESLINSYLDSCSKAEYYFMHDESNISTIAIVETYFDTKQEDPYCTNDVSIIENIDSFLLDLQNTDYCYSYRETEDSLYEDEHKKAVRISYDNGDYEIFSNNLRCQYISTTDTTVMHTYIGDFDQDQFNALIEKYSK